MHALLTVLVLLLCSTLLRANDSRSDHKAFHAFLQDYRIEKRIESLSVAVAEGGEVVFASCYGYQDHDTEEPATAETTYLVASITKTFSAATLLGMEADGHIDLDMDFTTLSDWNRRCERLGKVGGHFGRWNAR